MRVKSGLFLFTMKLLFKCILVQLTKTQHLLVTNSSKMTVC